MYFAYFHVFFFEKNYLYLHPRLRLKPFLNMKNQLKTLIFTLIFTLPMFIQSVLADPPGPPGPGGNPGGAGGVPVGSPIDNETIVLLVLAFAYGVYKIIEFRRNRAAEEASR